MVVVVVVVVDEHICKLSERTPLANCFFSRRRKVGNLGISRSLYVISAVCSPTDIPDAFVFNNYTRMRLVPGTFRRKFREFPNLKYLPSPRSFSLHFAIHHLYSFFLLNLSNWTSIFFFLLLFSLSMLQLSIASLIHSKKIYHCSFLFEQKKSSIKRVCR